MTLLRQNGELVEDGIWNWTLPAWITKLADGRVVNVCPSAGACKEFCYARNGTYLFPAVQASHKRNLRVILDKPALWQGAMIGHGQPQWTVPVGSVVTIDATAGTVTMAESAVR